MVYEDWQIDRPRCVLTHKPTGCSFLIYALPGDTVEFAATSIDGARHPELIELGRMAIGWYMVFGARHPSSPSFR